MKKVMSVVSFALIVILSAAGCFVRLFQLLRFTDKDTGLVVSSYGYSYAVYIMFFAASVLAVVFCFIVKSDKDILFAVLNKKNKILLAFLSLAYFYDFVHQCKNVYSYIKSTAYIDYNYVVVTALIGAAALLCCLYFFTVSKLTDGQPNDFSKLGLLHLMPIIWAVLRLIVIIMGIVDFKENAESFLEFLLLTVFICFCLSVIYSLDNQSLKNTRFFAWSCLAVLFCSLSLSLSRILAFATGKGDLLYSVEFSSPVYLFSGLLCMNCVVSLVKKDSK